MRLGIDLDNTIVCYDELFRALALERHLIPESLPQTKRAIRDHLRANGLEPAWTELQGLAYGLRMADAIPFPGALEFLRDLVSSKHEWWIISHRSPRPYAGPPYDLHAAARNWLLQQGVLTERTLDRLQLAATRSDKLTRITDCQCDTFIDDLPELLTDTEFPAAVRRILFDPSDENDDHSAYERVRSWSEIASRLDPASLTLPPATPPQPPQIQRGAERLSFSATARVAEILTAHLGTHPTVRAVHLEPWPGGGNNRVFRATLGEQSFLVKWYFSSADDRRDRLGNEWSFTTFAWNHGVRVVPRPIGYDRSEQLAVFEFISGQRLAEEEITEERVDEAGRFLVSLQAYRDSPAARQLPNASEACFSYAEHAQCIRSRVERLTHGIGPASDSAIAPFLRGDLLPAVQQTVDRLRDQAVRRGESWDSPLPTAERVVSPSDFGFHNALRDASGSLRFVDFEYAGWDDPAKTLCDFFLQVAVPVPSSYWRRLTHSLAGVLGEGVALRAAMLYPLYHIKWCCILLNPLLRAGGDRARFSGTADQGDLLSRRLDLAKRILARWKELQSDAI